MEEMKKYTYIQKLGNGHHLINDDYIMSYYPKQVSTKIAVETDEIGVKINGLKLQILGTYPEFLRKK